MRQRGEGQALARRLRLPRESVAARRRALHSENAGAIYASLRQRTLESVELLFGVEAESPHLHFRGALLEQITWRRWSHITSRRIKWRCMRR